MQTRNPFIDDLAKVANGAMGALTGVKDEVEARFRDQIAKILDGMDIPRRDEFDAVKAMATKAREENEELRKQIEAEAAVQTAEASRAHGEACLNQLAWCEARGIDDSNSVYGEDDGAESYYVTVQENRPEATYGDRHYS